MHLHSQPASAGLFQTQKRSPNELEKTPIRITLRRGEEEAELRLFLRVLSPVSGYLLRIGRWHVTRPICLEGALVIPRS